MTIVAATITERMSTVVASPLELLVRRVTATVAWSGIALAAAEAVALLTFKVFTLHNIAFSALPLLISQVALGIAWRHCVR